jgi:hypothetical protein
MRPSASRRRPRWLLPIAAVALVTTIVLVGATTCGRPPDTVKVHTGEPARATEGRRLAPRMAVQDHQERALELPVRGRVTLLSFASRSTVDRASQLCRDVRVAHPEIEIVEFLDASSVPGFMASKVKSKLADRHQSIVADTRQAFAAARATPPPDLEDRIHLVADWSGDAFEAYGAHATDHEVQIAVLDREGGLVSFFATTPTPAELAAAVVRASE